MSLHHLLAILVFAVASAASAMTIEEYTALPPEEKVKVLNAKPDRVLSDPSQLLRLYTISLRDASPTVQRAAAQSSAFLVMGLQSAKPSGRLPSFPDEDSADYQQALVAVLGHGDESVRSSSAIALAYSAPPNEAIENLLLARVATEPKQELKAAVLKAMGQVGYQSDRVVVATTALMQPEVDSRAIADAAKVLSHLKPDAALNTLISLASRNTPSQRHALTALAGYGQKAARAKPVLERLLTDQSVPEDIRNLARITLEAITTAEPQASNFQPMKLVSLWPVAVTKAEPGVNQQVPNPEPKSPKATPSTQAPATPAIASPAPTTPVAEVPVERRAPVWPWIVGIVALVVIVAMLAKRRG